MCTFCIVYSDLAKHYGIKHSMLDMMCKFCAPIFSYMQIIDTVMVKEGLHMEGCMGKLVPDGDNYDGAPAVEGMTR